MSKLDCYLAISGSPEHTDALLCKPDGTYIHSGRFTGFHIRDITQNALYKYFDTIASNLADWVGINSSELREFCKKMTIAISGADDRYKNSFNLLLLGEIRGLFKNISDTDLRIFGVAEAAYRALFDSQPGVLIRCSATCSIFGCDGPNKLIALGQTSIIGAPGSGYFLGQKVINIVKKTLDGIADQEEQEIAEAVLQEYDQPNALRFCEEVHTKRVKHGDTETLHYVSRFSNVLFSQAKAGNKKASNIIDETANYLATVTQVLIDKLKLKNNKFKLVFQGDLFELHPAIAKSIFNLIKSKYENVEYIEANEIFFSRVVGAAKLALCAHPTDYSRSKKIDKLEQSIRGLSQTTHGHLFWQPVKIRGI